MTRAALFFMTLTAMSASQWEVSFTPHKDNVYVMIDTACQSQHYRALDYFPIEDASTSRLTVRRQPIPKGARCTVQAGVVRAKDDDPNNDYVAESTIVIQVDD